MIVSSSWRLDCFGEHIRRWKIDEHATRDLVDVVIRWALTRLDDPYADVRREPDFANLWFGEIPGSIRGDTVVVCSYWIYEHDRSVACDNIATLSRPV